MTPELADYHAPRQYGTCDGCESDLKRATHEMENGDDLCGLCYARRVGYVVDTNTDHYE